MDRRTILGMRLKRGFNDLILRRWWWWWWRRRWWWRWRPWRRRQRREV